MKWKLTGGLENYQLQKNLRLHFVVPCTNIEDAILFIIVFIIFLSNIIFKSNLVLIN